MKNSLKYWVFIFTILFGCSKGSQIEKNEKVDTKHFFSRVSDSKSENQIRSNSSEIEKTGDIIDTAINLLKIGNEAKNIVNPIVLNYGLPFWDYSMVLKNINGLKTVLVPVVDDNNEVRLIILGYQNRKDKMVFKFLSRNTVQSNLPQSGDKLGTILSQQSIEGIFEVFNKRIKKVNLRQSSSNPLNNITSNGIFVSYECWYQTWTGSDGSFGITDTQCSFSLIITGGIIYNLIGEVQIPQLDETNGGGYSDTECLNEQINNFSSEAGGASTSSEGISENTYAIDPFTKNVSLSWRCLKGFGGWSLVSHESGVIKLVDINNNQWAWVSLSHNSISMQGSPLPGTSISHSSGVGTPSFTESTAQSTNVFYAGIELKFSVTYTPICSCAGVVAILLTPITYNYTAPKFWQAKP